MAYADFFCLSMQSLHGYLEINDIKLAPEIQKVVVTCINEFR